MATKIPRARAQLADARRMCVKAIELIDEALGCMTRKYGAKTEELTPDLTAKVRAFAFMSPQTPHEFMASKFNLAIVDVEKALANPEPAAEPKRRKRRAG